MKILGLFSYLYPIWIIKANLGQQVGQISICLQQKGYKGEKRENKQL